MQDKLKDIAAPLLGWYRKNRRALPWRQDREPYHVWISEIMLQQTRIEPVKLYYARFMETLPDVSALAAADDDTLLKLWEGLGYYSRARNLKKAAVMITEEYGGVFPRSYEQLRRLPGVGDYTAGAIASICFDEKAPAVDGNVLRVIARLTGCRDNVLLPQTKRAVTERLRAVMPEEAGAFNEALMELGETVCLPNGAPDCGRCPLAALCTAYREDLTDALPVRIKTVKRRKEEKTVLLLCSPDGRIAVEKRPDKGLLSGMYQLPDLDGFHTDEELAAHLRDLSLEPLDITFIKESKHVFTHIDWYMRGYRVSVKEAGGRFIWVTEEEREAAYPLPTAFRRFL